MDRRLYSGHLRFPAPSLIPFRVSPFHDSATVAYRGQTQALSDKSHSHHILATHSWSSWIHAVKLPVARVQALMRRQTFPMPIREASA